MRWVLSRIITDRQLDCPPRQDAGNQNPGKKPPPAPEDPTENIPAGQGLKNTECSGQNNSEKSIVPKALACADAAKSPCAAAVMDVVRPHVGHGTPSTTIDRHAGRPICTCVPSPLLRAVRDKPAASIAQHGKAVSTPARRTPWNLRAGVFGTAGMTLLSGMISSPSLAVYCRHRLEAGSTNSRGLATEDTKVTKFW